MDQQRLLVFVTVAQVGSFTGAAERLHLGQSGVSNAVRAFERELGADLFDRATTPVTLTEAGAALLPEARGALDAMERAKQAVTEVAGGLRGTLRLGILYGLTPPRVWDALARFRTAHPAVDLRLTGPGSEGSADHTTRVRDGSLDAAVVISSGAITGVTQHALQAEDLLLACPTQHPLTQVATLSMADLANETLIDFPRGWGVRTAVDLAFAAAGIAGREPAVEMNDVSTILHLVRLGVGVAFVPSIMRDSAPDLTYLRVSRRPPGYRICLAVPAARPTTPSVRTFLAEVVSDTPVSPRRSRT